MVTTHENRPKFSTSIHSGIQKIIERGGVLSLWKGNGTSCIHRFPFSAINFFCYEQMLDVLTGAGRVDEDDHDYSSDQGYDAIPTLYRFFAGSVAGSMACIACYPLDLVRTRLTTELPGHEHYTGITDAFTKILRKEGFFGLYSGLTPTLFVAVPSFAISYTVYGTLKEYVLDDDLFYNLRRIDDKSGQETLGLRATLLCGAASGTASTLVTFPFDTIRRRMQIQNLHIAEGDRLTTKQLTHRLFVKEGFRGLYRGLTPELLKVVPMVGTMFFVYEYLKRQLNV